MDLADDELVVSNANRTTVLGRGTAKDFHHRYPQFTEDDLDESFRATRRRWHGVTRWTRFYEDGESLSDQEEADAAAIAEARARAEETIERGDVNDLPFARPLSTVEEALAPKDDVEETLAFERFDTATNADLVRDEQALRSKIRDAAARGDMEEMDKLVKEAEARLGGRPEQSELARRRNDAEEERAHYFRRVGRFVDAVYGSNVKEMHPELDVRSCWGELLQGPAVLVLRDACRPLGTPCLLLLHAASLCVSFVRAGS